MNRKVKTGKSRHGEEDKLGDIGLVKKPGPRRRLNKRLGTIKVKTLEIIVCVNYTGG